MWICDRGAAITVLLSLSSCSYFVSWDDVSRDWVGAPIARLVSVWGDPDEVIAGREYKYALKRVDPSCVHYWIVDEHGTIVGYRYTGRCEPY